MPSYNLSIQSAGKSATWSHIGELWESFTDLYLMALLAALPIIIIVGALMFGIKSAIPNACKAFKQYDATQETKHIIQCIGWVSLFFLVMIGAVLFAVIPILFLSFAISP